MKICPNCQKTYSDDNLNFCLDDGTILTQREAQPLPQTVLFNQPPVTQQNRAMPSQPSSQSTWTAARQGQYLSQPPPKASKTWIWAVGILGILVLVCGGGIVGAFVWVGNQSGRASNNTNVKINQSASPTPSVKNDRSPTPSPTAEIKRFSLNTGTYNGTARNTTYNRTGDLMLRIDSVDSSGNVRGYFEASHGLVGHSTMTGTITEGGKLELHGTLDNGKQFAVSGTVSGDTIRAGYGIASGGDNSESGVFTVTRR